MIYFFNGNGMVSSQCQIIEPKQTNGFFRRDRFVTFLFRSVRSVSTIKIRSGIRDTRRNEKKGAMLLPSG